MGVTNVKLMIRLLVEGAKRNDCHSGSCGQALPDYSEMAEFLVEIGMNSISLIPDAVIKTTIRVLEVEKRLGRSPRPHCRLRLQLGYACHVTGILMKSVSWWTAS